MAKTKKTSGIIVTEEVRAAEEAKTAEDAHAANIQIAVEAKAAEEVKATEEAKASERKAAEEVKAAEEAKAAEDAKGSEEEIEEDELEQLLTIEEFTKDLQAVYNDTIGELAAALFEPLFHILDDQKYKIGGSKAVDLRGPDGLTSEQKEMLIKSNQDRAAEQLKKIREGQRKASQKENL